MDKKSIIIVLDLPQYSEDATRDVFLENVARYYRDSLVKQNPTTLRLLSFVSEPSITKSLNEAMVDAPEINLMHSSRGIQQQVFDNEMLRATPNNTLLDDLHCPIVGT